MSFQETSPANYFELTQSGRVCKTFITTLLLLVSLWVLIAVCSLTFGSSGVRCKLAVLKIYTIPASSSQCSAVFFCKLSSGIYQRPLCSVVTGPAIRPHRPAIYLPAAVSPICTGSLPSDRLLLLLFLY